MRRIALLTALLLAFSLAALAQPAEARTIACTSVLHPGCYGVVCYDQDLDGRIDPNSDPCLVFHCPEDCLPLDWE